MLSFYEIKHLLFKIKENRHLKKKLNYCLSMTMNKIPQHYPAYSNILRAKSLVLSMSSARRLNSQDHFTTYCRVHLCGFFLTVVKYSFNLNPPTQVGSDKGPISDTAGTPHHVTSRPNRKLRY